MKYLCLVYEEEKMLSAMSTSQFQDLVDAHLILNESIEKSGNRIVAESLQFVDTAKTIRVRDGNLSITDGPFAETKEQLGGFYLIRAKDMDEAIEIAAKIPSARHGSIEIRPIRELVSSRRA